MGKRMLAALVATVLTTGILYAQEVQKTVVPVAGTNTTAGTLREEIIPEWLYGEVVSVDIPGKSLQVRYLDYNTDIEKQDTVFTDDKTLLEGIKSLPDLKPQDTVSVDYIIDGDGKFRAVAVSLETFEEDTTPVLEELMPEPQKVGPSAGK